MASVYSSAYCIYTVLCQLTSIASYHSVIVPILIIINITDNICLMIKHQLHTTYAWLTSVTRMCFSILQDVGEWKILV